MMKISPTLLSRTWQRTHRSRTAVAALIAVGLGLSACHPPAGRPSRARDERDSTLVAPRPSAPRTARLGHISEPVEHLLSDTARYFLELAFGNEVGRSVDALRTWQTAVRVRAAGSVTAADSMELRATIAELNAIVGRPFIQLVTRGENCTVDFTSRATFSRLATPQERRAEGHVWVWWDAEYQITSARILIRDDLAPGRRAHLLREELAQALGLLNDSWQYPESMFYQGRTTLVTFSPMDRAVIRLLDAHRGLTGRSRSAVAAHLAHAAGRDAGGGESP